MENVNKIIRLSAFVALATFLTLAALVTLAACANPASEDGVGEESVYSGMRNGATYTLTVQLSKGRTEPEADNKYTLTANSGTSEKKSTGTIKTFYPGTTCTFYLQPGVKGASEFTVFTRDSSIFHTRNSITWDDGTRSQEIGAFYVPPYNPGSNTGGNTNGNPGSSNTGNPGNPPPVTTYAVTMQNDGNGTASANPASAASGATVTITATPNVGYGFTGWQVVSGGVTLSSATASPATFTMPANAVTIKAAFYELPPNTPYLSFSAVSFDAVAYGYAQPTAKDITIENTGDVAATVSGISLSGDNPNSFTLSHSITSVEPNGGTATFTVQPKAGLGAGTYKAVITATYKGGAVTTPKTEEADLSFTVNKATPVAGDFDITFTQSQTLPTITAPTIAPKAGKSEGTVTIKYNNSTTLPSAAGTFTVTFDVAAATDGNWNAATNLAAGTLTVSLATLSGNVSITPNTNVFVNTPLTASYDGGESVTYQWNRSGSAINGATGATYTPTQTGSHTVTVSVPNYTSKTSAAVTVAALSTPVRSDYTISKLFQTVGSVVQVSITANTGKSPGAISISYNGSAALPTAAGTYPVTFNVAAATGWTAATGLSAGNLVIGLPVVKLDGTPMTWNAAVEAINTAGDGTSSVRKSYAIEVIEDFERNGSIGNTFSPSYIDVTIFGNKTMTRIGGGNGSNLFRIGDNQAVIMFDLILKNYGNASEALVDLYGTNAAFTMNSGEVSGNTSNNGAVWADQGTFTMNGGKISGNERGVYVSGTFNMSGGEISGSTNCGVYLRALSTFNMTGGKVLDNNSRGAGGGVYVLSSTFNMSGGEVSGNTATEVGGGVFVTGGTFTMSGGTVSGNTANRGGGVSVYRESNSIFRISGGTVYGSDAAGNDANGKPLANTAISGGAALYKDSNGIAEYGSGSTWTLIPLDDGSARAATIHVSGGTLTP